MIYYIYIKYLRYLRLFQKEIMFRLTRILKNKNYPNVKKRVNQAVDDSVAKADFNKLFKIAKAPPSIKSVPKNAPPTFTQAKIAAPPSFGNAKIAADLSDPLSGDWKELRNSFQDKEWKVPEAAVQDDQQVPGHEMSFVERSRHFNQQVAKNPALMFSFNTKAKAYGYDPKSPKVIMFRLLNVSMNVYIAWWLYTWLTSEDDKEDQNVEQSTAIKSTENDISIYGKIAQQKQQYQQQSLQNSQVGQQYQTYATLEKQQDSDFETYKSGKSEK